MRGFVVWMTKNRLDAKNSGHILASAHESSMDAGRLPAVKRRFSASKTSILAKSATGCLKINRTNIYVLKSVDSKSTIPIMRLHTAGVISSVGRASPLQGGGRRFEPVITHHFGSLAQLVEQLTFNQLVAGSNPARPTNSEKSAFKALFSFLPHSHSRAG